MKTLNFENFVKSYLATAAWVTIETGECDKFTKEAIDIAVYDCKKFIDKVCAAFPPDVANELLCTPASDFDYRAPHDFFLTRNGHGVGFWDSEDIYGVEAAAKLTEISQEMKGCDCYHIRGKKSKLTFN